MSNTHKGSRGPGFEYWASRYKHFGDKPGRVTKTLTHHKERRAAKDELRLNPDEAKKMAAGGM